MAYFALVGIGGAMGAMTRHMIDRLAASQFDSPLVSTFVVNISGSFVLGILVGFVASHHTLPEETRVFLAVGFLASYTSFSTLSVATIHLLQKGDLFAAILNLSGSVLIGLIAAFAGMMLAKTI